MNMEISSSVRELIFNEFSALQMTPKRLTEINSWHGHIPFGFWLVKTLAPSVLVELGVHRGDSYSAFCQAVESFSLDTACYGVDTWEGEEHAGAYDGVIFEEYSSYHNGRYGNFSRLIRTTFDDALCYFADGSVDLLHIDGRHKYEDVKHDFESWLPKLSSRAVVLFHDINVRERDFGVWKFFRELSQNSASRTFSFLHSHGLGVLLVGDKVPETLEHLCSLGDDDAAYVRLAFSFFGKGINAHSTELSLRASLEEQASVNRYRDQVDLQRESESRKKEVDFYKAEFELVCALRESNRQIAELHSVVSERDRQIEELQRVSKLLMQSLSMRLTEPLRTGLQTIRRVRRALSLVGPAIKRGGGVFRALHKAVRLYRMYGFEGVKRGFRAAAASEQQAD